MSVKRTLTTANALVRFRQAADVQASETGFLPLVISRHLNTKSLRAVCGQSEFGIRFSVSALK